eukprot:gene24907-30370_t
MYVDKKGVPMPENTTWPVDGEFGLDVLIEPVDSRLVLNYPSVPLPQPYWLTALFAEKKFSASAGCLNNKQANLNKSLSVEADRVGMNFLLQEAVKAFEKGMREFFIAPVETIHHHKNRGGK